MIQVQTRKFEVGQPVEVTGPLFFSGDTGVVDAVFLFGSYGVTMDTSGKKLSFSYKELKPREED